MRGPVGGGILGAVLGHEVVIQPTGTAFWDVFLVLKKHLDELVSLDDIIFGCPTIFGRNPEDYGIRKARREVQNAISKLRQAGFTIESIKEGDQQIAYCWAGDYIDKHKTEREARQKAIQKNLVETAMVMGAWEQFKKDSAFAEEHRREWLKFYPDRWVAVFKEKLLGSDASMEKIMEMVKLQDIRRPYEAVFISLPTKRTS